MSVSTTDEMTESEFVRANPPATSTSFELPSHDVFRNLKNAQRFAMDIGGSLAKLAYYSTVEVKEMCSKASSPRSRAVATPRTERSHICGRLHFIKFELRYIESCLEFIASNLKECGELLHVGNSVNGTGAGIHKYKDLIKAKLGVEVNKEDEIECLTKGCVFVLRNIPDEAFLYDHTARPQFLFCGIDQMTFPFLLVNIGSGVSFIKVESEQYYERIGGTATGGGTFWGLGALITQAKTFDELLSLAATGDHRNVDMLVGDITGVADTYAGLHRDLIASSFGKAARSIEGAGDTFNRADLARSLLLNISNDIGQIAYLYARLHNLSNIYFGGFFIRGHPITMRTITYAIHFWSQDKMKALFLRHEGYLGAIGAFLKGTEEQEASDCCSWGENYVGSSGLQSPKMSSFMHTHRANFYDTLEFDQHTRPLVPLSLLLDPPTYFPDTVDLTQDAEARHYWLQCFIDSSERFRLQAYNSQMNQSDVLVRANKYKDMYVTRIEEFKLNPSAYGSLTVRSLLDLNSHCLQAFNFPDPFFEQKAAENEVALRQLPDLLAKLDVLEWAEKQLAIATGLLAGNVFDWGAKEVIDIMTGDEDFGFYDAKNKLQARPWLVDDYEEWVDRLEIGYKCAAIFCDNSGADIILGVLPLVISLLDAGTDVILCANPRPALNDVTHQELSSVLDTVARVNPLVATSLQDGSLMAVESGQSSPCLDLRLIDTDLVQLMASKHADLLIIEGMGRAIHTNYHAAFSCDSLRVAVLKNRWLAQRLGGNTFDVIFKFVRGQEIHANNNDSL